MKGQDVKRPHQGTQIFGRGVLRGISYVVLTSHLALIGAPAAAAVQQEVFGRPKPLTENSIAQSELAQLREAMRQHRLEQQLAARAPATVTDKLKALFTDSPTVKAEKALAETLVAGKAALLAEAAQQDQELAATRADLVGKKLPEVILARHDAAVQTIQQRRAELLGQLDRLQQAQAGDNDAERAQLLNDIDKKLEAWGGKQQAKTDFKHLPWGSPDSKVRAPHSSKTAYSLNLEMFGIKPLQVAGPIPAGTVLPVLPKLPAAPQPADLTETEDIKLTPAIRAKAAELHHNPAEIQRWVHDNIEYIPTYGSIQGADYALQTKRGNAFDTSSLLIALLRASGVPSRYVYGTVEVPMDQAMNWVGGVTNPYAVLELMGQGGIPNIGLTLGGKLVSVRMEHVWVEAFVDFVPSRGTKNRTPDTWVPMDASFKQYTYTAPMDLQQAVPFDAQALLTDVQTGAVIDETQGYVQNIDQSKIQTALMNYQAQVKAYLEQQPDKTVGDVLGTKTIQPLKANLLSQALPMKLVATAGDVQVLPATMRHYFNYSLYSDVFSRNGDSPAFQQKLSLPYLAGKSLSLSFRPSTPHDEAVINSYLPQPHSDGTPIDPSELPSSLPGYLIHVSPELIIDGQVVAAGSEVMLGSDVFTRASITSPNSSLSGVTSENLVTAGEYHAIAINGHGVSSEQLSELKKRLEETKEKIQSQQISVLSKHRISGDILEAGARGYFTTIDVQDLVATRANQIVAYRLPSYGSLATTLKPIYSWGLPKTVRGSGVTMDMDRVSSSVVHKNNDSEQVKIYRLQSGQRMSGNEHAVPEQLFSSEEKNVNGVSAIEALRSAAHSGQRIYAINAANVQNIIPEMTLSQSVKKEIIDAVGSGYSVIASQHNISLSGWVGAGYIILDSGTNVGAYKISGGQNGAAFALAQYGGLTHSISNEGLNIDVVSSVSAAAIASASAATASHMQECLRDKVSQVVIAYLVVLAVALMARLAAYLAPIIAVMIILTSLVARGALAITTQIPADCICESLIFSDLVPPQCWICHRSQHIPITGHTQERKNWANYLGGCRADPSPYSNEELLVRHYAWSSFAAAREAENACWRPQHQGHIDAARDARTTAQTCLGRMR